ncbi:MAG: hypothetical protein WA755_15785 [Candidatus Acidiferrales bacterium]
MRFALFLRACCHVRLAVEVAHAERIGHGVDIMYEDYPYDLLKEMAVKHILVEVNLTSNDVILGVSGKDHPFPIYRKFGVPVAFTRTVPACATDRPGNAKPGAACAAFLRSSERAQQQWKLEYRFRAFEASF